MINLGDVTFSLGADVAQLQRSIQRLNEFGRTVSSVQNAQTRGASQIAAALRRQERAAVDAFNKVQNLNNAMARTKGTGQFIRSAERAYDQLNRTLTTGTLNALQYQRAMSTFNTQIGSTKRQFESLIATQNGLVGSNKNLVSGLQNMANGFVLVNGPLGGLATRIVSVTSIVKRGGVEIAAFVAGFAGGLWAIQRFGSAVLQAGKQMNSFISQFTAIRGTIYGAYDALADVEGIAKFAGVRIEDLANGLARFEAAAAGVITDGRKVRDTFTTISAAAAKLQLGSEQTQGIFRAFEQIMSKGTVQAEELRGQLGDRLPGAFQIASRAMGVTTRQLGELMKKGLVPAADFIPKFVAELKKTFNIDDKPIENYTASLNRMTNSWFSFRAELDRQFGVTDRIMQLFNRVAQVLDYLGKNLQQVRIYALTAGGALFGLVAPAVIGGMVALAKAVGLVVFQMGLLNKVIMLNPIGAFLSVAVRLGFVIGGAIAALSSMKDEIIIVKGEFATLGDYMRVAAQEIQANTAATVAAVKGAWYGFKDWWTVLWQDISASSGITWQDIKRYAYDGTNAFMNIMNNLNDAIPRILSGIPYAVASTAIEAMNWMILKIEEGLNKIVAVARTRLADLESAFGSVFDFEIPDINLGRIANDYKAVWKQTETEVNSIMSRERDYIQETLDKIEEYRKRANSIGRIRQLNSFREQELASRGVDYGLNGSSIKPITTDPGDTSGDSKAAKKLQKQAEAIENINRAIERTYEEVDALGGTEHGLRMLTDQFKREDEVRKYARAMEKAGVETSKVTALSAQLLHVLEMRDELELARQGMEMWRDTLVSSFDTVSALLVDSIFDGGEAMKKLPDIAKAVARDIFNTWLQLTLMNPLKNMLFGTSAPTGFGGLFGAFGSGTGGFAPMAMAAINGGGGGLYRQGGVVGPILAGSGRMLNHPTKMMTGQGPVIGGEAGKEVIMPLTRDSSGRMGVKGFGSGGEGGITIHTTYAPQYNVTGNTQDIQELRRQLARDRAQHESKTIEAIRKAKKSRMI